MKIPNKLIESFMKNLNKWDKQDIGRLCKIMQKEFNGRSRKIKMKLDFEQVTKDGTS